MVEFIFCLLLIVGFARLFGKIALKVGQPRVVGEMFAGIMLGPSILGYLSPDFFTLIAVDMNQSFYFLSQLGLAFYMFIVGLELENKVFQRDNVLKAMVLATSGIVFVFALSFVASWYTYDFFNLKEISRISFSLFMGSAFSLTAFPMLARILQERDLTTSRFGSLTISVASIDDVVAWIILAFMMAIIQSGDIFSCIIITLKLGLYIIVMLKVIRPILVRLIKVEVNQGSFSIILIVFLLSILTTEAIGIHAVFGGFIAGLIIPRNDGVIESIRVRLNDFVTVFLVPIFFVYSGMNTTLGVFTNSSLLLPLILYVFVSILGKYGAIMVVCRKIGFSWRDASAIGSLMNARGLMILIFGNIGITYGLISKDVYSIIVIVAIVTTAMTYPIFNLSYPNNQDNANSLKKAS